MSDLLEDLFGEIGNQGAPTKKARAKKIGGKEYKRPNGMVYVSRPVPGTDLDDVELLRSHYEAREPVLLYGAPGCGKTALFEAAFPEGIVFQASGDTERSDFVGSYVPTGPDSFDWLAGKLARAAEEGLPFLWDECALTPPKTGAVAYGLMDGRGVLDVPENPAIGEVTVSDGFLVFGACNPNVVGADMSDALLSRFLHHIEMGMDWALMERLNVPEDAIRLGRVMEADTEAGNLAWFPGIRDMLAFRDISARLGVNYAAQNIISRAPELDRGAVAEHISRTFGLSLSALKIAG